MHDCLDSNSKCHSPKSRRMSEWKGSTAAAAVQILTNA